MSPDPSTLDTLERSLLFVRGEVFRDGWQAHAWAEPAAERSGDWWDLRTLGTGAMLVVADAVGHGDAASWLASMAQGGLRMAYLGIRDDLQPYMLLTMLNQLWVDALGETPVMSMLAARVDHGRLAYALAGHPPPVLTDGRAARRLASDGSPPLGARRALRYHQQDVAIAPDEVLVAHTDGITDADDAAGARFGDRRFLRACCGSPHEPAAIVRRVREAFTKHQGAARPTDDVSVVAWALTVR